MQRDLRIRSLEAERHAFEGEARGIWHSNDRAEEMLQTGVVVQKRAGLLACHDQAGDEAMTEVLYHLQSTRSESQTTPTRRVVSLRGSDGLVYLAFVSAVQPARTMGAFGHSARALVIFHDPRSLHAGPDLLVVTECFDFTPAEARVALAIANGANPKQIAQKTGLGLSTVRSHLQRVMQKAGVERQADLVRVLLTLPGRV